MVGKYGRDALIFRPWFVGQYQLIAMRTSTMGSLKKLRQNKGSAEQWSSLICESKASNWSSHPSLNFGRTSNLWRHILEASISVTKLFHEVTTAATWNCTVTMWSSEDTSNILLSFFLDMLFCWRIRDCIGSLRNKGKTKVPRNNNCRPQFICESKASNWSSHPSLNFGRTSNLWRHILEASISVTKLFHEVTTAATWNCDNVKFWRYIEHSTVILSGHAFLLTDSGLNRVTKK